MGNNSKFLIVVPTPLTSPCKSQFHLKYMCRTNRRSGMSESEKHAGETLGFVALYTTDTWKTFKTEAARKGYLATHMLACVDRTEEG